MLKVRAKTAEVDAEDNEGQTALQVAMAYDQEAMVDMLIAHGARFGNQGCLRREGTSEAASEAVGQAVGGGCRSVWGRLLSVTNGIEPGVCRQRDSGWA